MSISKNTVKYLLMILGVIILLATYFLVYMDYSDKTDALNTEITALNTRLSQLSAYSDQLPKYKSGIDQDKSAISDTLNKYYSNETPEDFIMFATAMEDTYNLHITGLSFTDPTPVCSIAGVRDNGDYSAPLEPMALTGYKISSTLDGVMDYSQMKSALDFINDQPDVTKLDSLSLSYDSSTGQIMGSFVIDKYFITGRDIQEHQPTIPYTDIGKSVLIGG